MLLPYLCTATHPCQAHRFRSLTYSIHHRQTDIDLGRGTHLAWPESQSTHMGRGEIEGRVSQRPYIYT
jgi:hypothetical protein